MIASPPERSAPYDRDNLLDGLTRESTLELHYLHAMRREQSVLARRLANPERRRAVGGRGLAPRAPPVSRARRSGSWPSTPIPIASPAWPRAGAPTRPGSGTPAGWGCPSARSTSSSTGSCCTTSPTRARSSRASPRRPDCSDPAARSWRSSPGCGIRSALGLALANRAGAATAIHGTPDDIPLSPRRLVAHARDAGLVPELHAITYTWRRLPRSVQRALQPVDELGSRPRAAPFGHTLLLIARAGNG